MSDEAHKLIGRICGTLDSHAAALLNDEQALNRIRELYRAYHAQQQEQLEALKK